MDYKLDERIYEEILKNFSDRIEKMYIRVIIAEMNFLLQNNQLKGKNAREKYIYYDTNYLSKDYFVENIMNLYPGLYRNILDTIYYFSESVKYVIDSFYKDYQEICTFFGIPEKSKIQKVLIGKGDSHNGGKSVTFIEFCNNKKIVFKPRDGKNEEFFSKILNYICSNMNINNKTIKILKGTEYHWCEFIEFKECESENQLKLFYKKMGILIFVAYLFGTSDLHAENLVAFGDSPVLLDLENLVNQDINVSSQIIEKIKKSILFSGLLPSFHWNLNGNGVNLSALSNNEQTQIPVKVPVVVDYGTTDMHIQYVSPVLKGVSNIPHYKEKKANFLDFEANIIEGFNMAYKFCMKNKKDIYNIISEEITDLKNRVIFEDTQKYSMLLMSSFHPDLLLDSGNREIYFNLLRKHRNSKYDAIISEEISALKRGDIPYFYQKIDEKQVQTGNTYLKEIQTDQSPKEIIFNNLKALNVQDVKLQIELLKKSFDIYRLNATNLTREKQEIFENNKKNENEKLKFIKKVFEKVKRETIKTESDISWYVPKLIRDYWILQEMGMYLYDGIAGIFVFTHFLDQSGIVDVDKIFLREINKKMFEYTNKCCSNMDKKSRKTGIYDGESSIVYAYLLVYQVTHSKIYLSYAKKHCLFLKNYIEDDKKLDLLQGNAGAIITFTLMYEQTGKNVYLLWAEIAAKRLLSLSINMKKGITWISEEEKKPLLGLSHGNAGIAWAFAKLYNVTKKIEYQEVVKNSIKFENENYNSSANDWRDFREMKKKTEGLISWCHGAGGIILSRYNIKKLCDDIEIITMCEKDIISNMKWIKRRKDRENMCLCHGVCGNYEIIKKCFENKEPIQEVPLKNIENLPLQEKVSLGMMNGLMGIAYTYLRERIPQYPNIINLDVNNEGV